MRTAKLSTAGPAFAALLRESAVSQLPFDGLLIGNLNKELWFRNLSPDLLVFGRTYYSMLLYRYLHNQT